MREEGERNGKVKLGRKELNRIMKGLKVGKAAVGCTCSQVINIWEMKGEGVGKMVL